MTAQGASQTDPKPDLLSSAGYRRLVMLAGLASVTTAVVFLCLKIGVWFVSSSSSMFASLTDSLFDSMTAVLNLLALRFSVAPADREHRFGHFKAQSLASLAQAAFIGGSAVLIIVHGLEHMRDPKPVSYVGLAIAVSVVTTAGTLLLVAFQSFVYRRTRSEAIGADRFHYLSDSMLNVGVIIALILCSQGYLWADGLFASIIGALIFLGAFNIGKNAVATLLDKSLSPEENEAIMRAMLKVKGVKSLHDLKTRRAGPQCFIQCHLVLNGRMPLKAAHSIVNKAESEVEKLFPDADLTIHMEPDEKQTYDEVKFTLEKGFDDGEAFKTPHAPGPS